MAFGIAMGYLLTFSALIPLSQVFSLRFSALLLIFFALSLPHYVHYLKIAQFKKEPYQEIIPLLESKRVRYLATDFSIAYPIYFLTHRNVKVTDSLGPVSISFFYPWLREAMGKGFTFLSRIMLQVWVSDFTCGLKCFSAKAAKSIFPRLTIDRWGFDSQSLFLAKFFGFSVKEVPVCWKNDRLTRVKFPQDIARSLLDLLTIRLNAWRGVYKQPMPPILI